jgi:hypothetical protein
MRLATADVTVYVNDSRQGGASVPAQEASSAASAMVVEGAR